MACIKAFKSIRPAKGLENKIAALPYDVFNREEALEEVRREPLSFLNIDRPETQFDASVSMYDERVYKKAHDILWDMFYNGEFIKEKKECLYVYTLEMNGHCQSGIVACASIDDYLNNIIKKHENTREEKERDRIHHVDSCGAQTGPIFLAYKHNDEINNIINKVMCQEPIYNFKSSDGIKHMVHRIDNDNFISRIIEVFSEINSLYIADGHHRAASAVKAGLLRREQEVSKRLDKNPNMNDNNSCNEYDYFLSVIFPDDQLMIMDYNRVVSDLYCMKTDEFIEKIQKVYDITEESDSAIKPRKKGEIGMYLARKWYKLNTRSQYICDDPVKGMDVSILQDNILSPILGIDDPKTNNRIRFIGGIRGIEELKRAADLTCGVAFAMYPISMKELFEVADSGLLMPPKSTWFEPKLRSGLFIHAIDEERSNVINHCN